MKPVSRTRRVLAVVVVATALCADQAIVAAETTRAPSEEIGQIASRLVNRLARHLGRAMPVVLDCPMRPAAPAAVSAKAPTVAVQSVDFARPALSPFQFRLPPPAV